MMQPSSILFLEIGLVLMIVQMFVLWLVHLRLKNAAVVDVGWAAGLGVLAVFYALFGPAVSSRKLVLILAVGFWASRLSWHLYSDRVANGRPEEGRYITLRASWGKRASINFLYFFLSQGILNVVLSLPFLLIAFNPAPTLSPLEFFAVLLWIVAWNGESFADRQLKAFKDDPNRIGRVCKRGLWGYSRHPNYFFEWLIWCAYALMALAAPHGALGLISPLVILFLLLKVSGIPPTEAQALKSRGDEYREYQRTTSAFFPWFPKQ